MSFRRASHSPSVTQTQLQAQTLPPQRLKRPDFCRYSSHVVPHHRPALSRRFSEIPLVLPLTPQELAHAEQAQAAPPPPPPPQQQPPKRPSLTRYKSHVVSDSFSWSPSSFFRRKTYREAKAQKLALIALAAVSLISIALVLHAWLVSTVSHVEIVITPRAAVRDHAPPVPVSGDSGASAGAPHPRHQHKRVPDGAPAFAFTEPAIEFGALVNFLAAFASNALPVTIDPAQPLDPDLVLGFNPRGAGAKEEVRGHVQDAWMRNPVVVFSDLQRGNPPASREAKAIINGLRLRPDPTIFEVDQRDDESVLRPLLSRLVGADELPVVVVGGSPIRSLKELIALRDSGRLKELITAAGAVIDGKKKRKARNH